MTSHVAEASVGGPWDYDVFISHAGEDTETVARPLAEKLRAVGLRVWLDQDILTLGDSIRAEIDQGLARSRQGVVILSPDYLAKPWPLAEFDALFARHLGGGKVILPVWHRVSGDEVRSRMPLVGGLYAVRTTDGLDAVVEAILRAIEKGRSRPVLRPVQTLQAPATPDREPGSRLHMTRAWVMQEGDPRTLIDLAVKIELVNVGPSSALGVRAIFEHPWLLVQPADDVLPVLPFDRSSVSQLAGIARGGTMEARGRVEACELPPIDLTLRLEYQDNLGRWWAYKVPARMEYNFPSERQWLRRQLRLLDGQARLEGPLSAPTIEFYGWQAQHESELRAWILTAEIIPRAKTLQQLQGAPGDPLITGLPSDDPQRIEAVLPHIRELADSNTMADDEHVDRARILLRRGIDRLDELTA